MKLWAPCAAAAALLSLPLLAGCGAALSSIEPIAPIAPISPGTTSIGHLQGNVYGGGVPVTGAKIFLYTASTAGYGITPAGAAGSRSTSLLNTSNSTSNGTRDTVTTDITYGDYYVLTDSNGDFNISGDYTCTPGTQLYLVSIGGNPGYGGTNSAVGLMTALPQCPSTGTLVGTGISFIYMNEVSTVAAAYAVAGFAHDPVHIGAPTGPPSAPTDALALTGIKNAFANAGNLYNFGPVTAGGSALASSTGIIRPQATVDTLANILQHCVNTFDASTTMPSGISAACTNLFATGGAGNTGKTTGSGTTVATADTATAAIFIAQHPGTNVATLYSYAITGGTAYLPKLGAAPNDLTVAIVYTAGGLKSNNSFSGNTDYGNPTEKGLAIDANGDAWVVNPSATLGTRNKAGTVGTTVSAFSPLGIPLSANGFTVGSSPVSVAFDASGYAWVANAGSNSVSKLVGTAAGTVGTNYGGSPFTWVTTDYGELPVDAQIDASGNVWVMNYGDYYSNRIGYTTNGDLLELTSEGAETANYNDTPGNFTQTQSVAIAPSGLVWITVISDCSFSIFTSSDKYSVTYASDASNCAMSGGLAFDATGNAWFAQENQNLILSTSGYSTTGFTPGSGQQTTPTLFGVAIDGNSNVWTTDLKNGSIYQTANNGDTITPAYGYTGYGNSGYSTTPNITNVIDSVAVDGSGNVWYHEYSTSAAALVELVGAATPVATPIAYGLANSKLGTRP